MGLISWWRERKAPRYFIRGNCPACSKGHEDTPLVIYEDDEGIFVVCPISKLRVALEVFVPKELKNEFQ